MGNTSTDKLKHLDHAEDHLINSGGDGFMHAVVTLVGVHNAILRQNSAVRLTVKYDGAPSIVFGTHPDTNQFFVASKSAFNKNPKINYTKDDVVANHGHAPGLVDKLVQALEYLPKVTPAGRIFQGDLMYTSSDLIVSDSKVSFKPNTITYSVEKVSKTGCKIIASKLGVAIHTEYVNMKATFGPDLSEFLDHPDVHVISTVVDPSAANYSVSMQKKFLSDIEKAVNLHKKHNYKHLSECEHLATYINDTVKTGETPSASGLIAHVKKRGELHKSNLKTERGKAAADEKTKAIANHIRLNRIAFNTSFKMYKYIQNAKHVQVSALANVNGGFEHRINEKLTGPEGHVAIIGNKPTKLVDRTTTGFAALNALSGGIRNIKKNK